MPRVYIILKNKPNNFGPKLFRSPKLSQVQQNSNLWKDFTMNDLGLSFFINWFTDFFTENLGTEGKIKIKIKYITSTLHFITRPTGLMLTC